MTAFSPVSAALEGFRVMRREPKAVVAWLGIWIVAICVVATSTSLVRRVGAPAAHPSSGVVDLVKRLGPLAILLLLSLIATTTATFRSVLTPEQRKAYYLRLGPNEARVSIAIAVTVICSPVVIGIVTYLLFVLFSPIMSLLPGMLRELAFIGAALTTIVITWVFVRLSLIPVETFDEHRFHMSAYWPITRGYFWSLFLSYVIWGIISALVSAVCTVIIFYLSQVILASGRPHTFQIGLVILVIPIVLLLALEFMLPWMLLCACQAYAYRAIAQQPAAPAKLA